MANLIKFFFEISITTTKYNAMNIFLHFNYSLDRRKYNTIKSKNFMTLYLFLLVFLMHPQWSFEKGIFTNVNYELLYIFLCLNTYTLFLPYYSLSQI